MPSYKFRILIDTEDEEEVFRDIVISGNADFEQFYQAIIQSFDFRGDQLASFYVSNDNWDKGHEIALMDMELSESLDSPSIMKETIIQELVTTSKQKFILVYDFLKMWCFLVELVEVIQENYEFPMLDLSVGESPLEDSKEIDLSGGFEMSGHSSVNLGNDFDDIFSDDPEDDEFGGFENIDDIDI